MPQFKPRSTEALLREAFTHEAESVLRCLFFARRADVEGRADIALVLRAIAEGEISQAFGHLELLDEAGSLEAGTDAAGDLASVVTAEEATMSRYTALASSARRAKLTDVAEWFESLVTAEAAHLEVLRRATPPPEA